MALPDFDAGVGHSFGLEFGNIVIKQIQEITGLKKEQDVIEMKSNTNDGKYMIKKLPGRWKAGEVTLTRGLTADNSFEQWIKNSELGNMSAARKGVRSSSTTSWGLRSSATSWRTPGRSRSRSAASRPETPPF